MQTETLREIQKQRNARNRDFGAQHRAPKKTSFAKARRRGTRQGTSSQSPSFWGGPSIFAGGDHILESEGGAPKNRACEEARYIAIQEGLPKPV